MTALKFKTWTESNAISEYEWLYCVHNILSRIPDSLDSDAVSGWAGLVLAHPEFWNSVNPILTKGAYYAHHIAHQDLKT